MECLNNDLTAENVLALAWRVGACPKRLVVSNEWQRADAENIRLYVCQNMEITLDPTLFWFDGYGQDYPQWRAEFERGMPLTFTALLNDRE